MFIDQDGNPRIGRILIAVTAGFIALSAVSWAFSVAFSGIYGAGEQQKQINDGQNQTFVYEHFFALDAAIRSQAHNAEQAMKALDNFNKQFPPSPREAFNVSEMRQSEETTFIGLLQICNDNVAEYNAQAQEFTKDRFLSKKLPSSFNPEACRNPSLLPPSASGQ